MAIDQDQTLINHHWNYFLALESDMAKVSRYVEFDRRNYETFSIELAHLLFAAASEFEIVGKLLCRAVEPARRVENITDIREGLMRNNTRKIAKESIYVPRYGLTIGTPLENFAKRRSPDWWGKYNQVKHSRDVHFPDANLWNALLALASLQIAILYYQVECTPMSMQVAVDNLKPASSLLRFRNDYYVMPTPVTRVL